MTQNDKDLLLKDLCARLPYGVKGEKYTIRMDGEFVPLIDVEIIIAEDIITLNGCPGYMIRPYLFPMSSMTEEQRIELYKVLGWGYESHYHLSKEWEDFNNSIDNNDLFIPATWVSDLNKMYNWLNKNHLDYRGLISMGLAEDATGKNIY